MCGFSRVSVLPWAAVPLVAPCQQLGSCRIITSNNVLGFFPCPSSCYFKSIKWFCSWCSLTRSQSPSNTPFGRWSPRHSRSAGRNPPSSHRSFALLRVSRGWRELVTDGQGICCVARGNGVQAVLSSAGCALPLAATFFWQQIAGVNISQTGSKCVHQKLRKIF